MVGGGQGCSEDAYLIKIGLFLLYLLVLSEENLVWLHINMSQTVLGKDRIVVFKVKVTAKDEQYSMNVGP